MKSLIKFEFHKLLRQKSFYICTVLTVAMAFVGLLLTKTIFNNNPEAVSGPLSGMQSMLTAINSSSFMMISGIFLALFACADYDHNTIKNLYSRGFSRNKVFFSKLIVGLTAVIIMFVLTLVFSFLAGTYFFGQDSAQSGNYAVLLIGQLIVALAFASFTFAVSQIFKKVGVSIALSILGPTLVGTVLSLGDSFLKFDSFKLKTYWIDGFMGDLSSLSTGTNRLAACIIFAIIYFALFVFAGCYFNRKSEF